MCVCVCVCLLLFAQAERDLTMKVKEYLFVVPFLHHVQFVRDEERMSRRKKNEQKNSVKSPFNQ